MLQRLLSFVVLMWYVVRFRGRLKVKKPLQVRIGRRFEINISKTGLVVFEGKASFRSDCIINCTSGTIRIGDGAFFNRGCSLNSHELVTIGSACLFGEAVLLYDHNHSVRPIDRKTNIKAQPVAIGNNVWIGSHSVICAGSSIGSNSVVGALSYVRSAIPPDTVSTQDFSLKTIEIKNDW